MTAPAAALVPLLLLSLTACVTHRGQLYLGTSDYELAHNEVADGASERFVLRIPGRSGQAALRVQTEYARQRPFLGLQLLELDKDTAARRGVPPYSGLLVQGTYERSAARRAGVLPGDVLLALGGRKTIYLTDAADVEVGLGEGQVVTAQVRRTDQELTLQLATQVREERVTDTESVALEAASARKAYAGVALRGIPAHWCERIYGEKRNAVVVANVEVGSPAWLAGLRAGDVIDRVDGRPVPPLPELSRAIVEQGESRTPMRWLVSRGPGEEYEAVVDLHDYSGETNVWIPLVFDLENGVYRDRWSLGPFGLLMSNRNTYVPDSSTRAVDTKNIFSALVGLFRVETSPDETEVRLLWFIRFQT